jgi:hypothetical protein
LSSNDTLTSIKTDVARILPQWSQRQGDDQRRVDSEQAWLTWHGQRLELRQQHSLTVLGEFRQWLQATEQIVLPKRPVGQVLQYVLPRWDGLVRYWVGIQSWRRS